MHVKICGLTNLADARIALNAGADLLGFNFYRPSPRYVAPEVAAGIITVLRGEFASSSFGCVGVFVNESRETMRVIQQQCGLDLLQLHGDETADDVYALAPDAFKALRPKAAAEVEEWSITARPPTFRLSEGKPRFLVDASHPKLYGGSGTAGNWNIACDIAARHPILLAGGLNPTNVADAIRAVRPWGVDVASGVERAPSLKDETKVKQFIAIAKEYR